MKGSLTSVNLEPTDSGSSILTLFHQTALKASGESKMRSKMRKMGWEYSTELEDGIKKTYSWFLENIENLKEVKLLKNKQ